MSNTPKDRNGNALEPGALYAAFLEADHPCDPPSVVAYVYWTGGELVHDDGDHTSFDGHTDYLVRQSTASINASVIDDQLFDDIAEGIAEYRATGGDL